MFINTLSSDISNFYKDWYQLSLATDDYSSAKFVMIDDLVSGQRASILDKESIEPNLRSFIKELSSLDNSSVIKDTEIKLGDSLQFLQGNINTKEEIANLLGCWWPVEDEELSQIKREFDLYAKESGKLFEIISTDNFLKELDEITQIAFTKVQKYTGVNLKTNFKIKTVSIEAKWRNMVTFEDDVLNLVINTHPMHEYSRLQLYSYAYHEVCGHIFHFLYMKENPGIFPHLNQINIHTKQSVFVEGFAQYMHKVCVEEVFTDDISKLSFLYFKLRFCLFHKASIDIVEQNISPKENALFHNKYLPMDDVDSLTLQYEALAKSPFFIYQVHSYHNGLRLFEGMEKENNRVDYIRDLLDTKTMCLFILDSISEIK